MKAVLHSADLADLAVPGWIFWLCERDDGQLNFETSSINFMLRTSAKVITAAVEDPFREGLETFGYFFGSFDVDKGIADFQRNVRQIR